jgi:type II secretory ATPase GspE/PulE/Tfp pilus assembly ATPase PilB-like protein
MDIDKKKLGEALLKAEKISKENLKHAFSMHDKIGGNFDALLLKLGYVADSDLMATIGILEGIPTVDIPSLVIPEKLVESIPKEIIEKHLVLPISKKGSTLTLAMSDINDLEVIEAIQFRTGLKVEPVLASKDAIRKAIVQFYSQEEMLKEKKETERRQKIPSLSKKILDALPKEFVERHCILPISQEGSTLTLSMLDIQDFNLVEEIQFRTGFKVEPVVGSKEVIQKGIVQLYFLEEKDVDRKTKVLEETLEWIEQNKIPWQDIAKVLLTILVEKNIVLPSDFKERMSKLAPENKS